MGEKQEKLEKRRLSDDYDIRENLAGKLIKSLFDMKDEPAKDDPNKGYEVVIRIPELEGKKKKKGVNTLSAYAY